MKYIKPHTKQALEAIEDGGYFNGKIYKGIVYVSGKKFNISGNEDYFLSNLPKKEITCSVVSNNVEFSSEIEDNEFNNDQNPFLYMLYKK